MCEPHLSPTCGQRLSPKLKWSLEEFSFLKLWGCFPYSWCLWAKIFSQQLEVTILCHMTVRSLAFLGWTEGPEASTKTRPPDLWPLVSPCLIVFLLAKQLRNFQLLNLARNVHLFHLMVTDNQRGYSLSLPHGLAPPMKSTTQFSQAASLWIWKSDSPVVWFLVNISFPHVAWSLLGSTLQ
jgi:hypothetical protein